MVRRIDDNIDGTEKIVVVSNPMFSWIFKNVFELNYTYLDPEEASGVDYIDKATIIVDSGFKRLMEGEGIDNVPNSLRNWYDDSLLIGLYEEGSPANSYRGYPYTSMRQNFWSDSIEVKANY